MEKIERLEYKEVTQKEASVLLLAPGIFNKNGGMFSYAALWSDEITKLNSNSTFVLDTKYADERLSEVSYHSFFSEKKKLAQLIAFLCFLLPTVITAPLFADYLKLAKSKNTSHILTSSLLAYPIIRTLLWRHKKLKVIYTLHDPKPHDEKISPIAKKIKTSFLNRLYQMSKENANFYLHIHSEALLNDCPEDIKRVIIHPHPLPRTLVKKQARTRRKTKFGFMGRIEAYKGLDILLEAFKTIGKEKDLCERIELIIVGRGDFEKEGWQRLDLDVTIENRVVTEMEFHTYMADLDCLILPYKKASQSGVGYLALAYNIPIIATNTGGLPEIVEQSKQEKSMLIPPGDSSRLIAAIRNF